MVVFLLVMSGQRTDFKMALMHFHSFLNMTLLRRLQDTKPTEEKVVEQSRKMRGTHSWDAVVPAMRKPVFVKEPLVQCNFGIVGSKQGCSLVRPVQLSNICPSLSSFCFWLWPSAHYRWEVCIWAVSLYYILPFFHHWTQVTYHALSRLNTT